MKKYLVLLVLLCLSLTACMHENENYDSHAYDSLQQPNLYQAPLTQYENDSDLQAALTFSNEFGIGFLLRNETGKRLYYNDDFRVDSLEMSNRHNRAGVQFISPSDTTEMHVNWENSRPTGIYTFERDFFTDADLTNLYTTLVLEFDVIGWYHLTDDPEPIPDDLQAFRDNRLRRGLEFQIAGGTSEIIVLASEVAVSRTTVAFNTANLSTWPFGHGLGYRLLVYDNGWKDAPTILDNWAIADIGLEIQGGEVIEDRFDFEWLYGPLANGRYMIMRQHRAGRMELLLVEFIIDDNTPMSLDGLPAANVNLNLYISEIAPTGLQLNVTNHMPQTFLYSGPFIVQKYVYGVWENIYELAAPGRYQLQIEENNNTAINENWSERFGKLPPGRYKLIAYFGSSNGGVIVTEEFNITQAAFDEYAGDAKLNPMFEQNIIITDVAATPTGMTIRWENISDRIFYTPWTGYWIESYSPEEGRNHNRLRESFDSIFTGPDADLRSVTIEISGGGSMTFDTTAVHPGQHVYQTIDWGRELPTGQYVISLGHFSPDEPGFKYWIMAWERFALGFVIE